MLHICRQSLKVVLFILLCIELLTDCGRENRHAGSLTKAKPKQIVTADLCLDIQLRNYVLFKDLV